MRNKFQLLFILFLTIIIFSFPSICFSESKTIESEHCGTYLGDMKNKKDLDDFRQGEKITLITSGLLTFTDPSKNRIKFECIRHIFSNYLEKVVVVRHTEKGRNICNKVKITFDPNVVNEYLNRENCIVPNSWDEDIDFVLIKKSDKIKIGLVIETKIPDLDGYKKETLENEEENRFHKMIDMDKGKYQVVDRRHLTKILDEQKLSSSGITDSETVKLGKILNLDIIVLRLIYENSRVTKVLKVDTGEVLLFKTYKTETKETEKKTEEGWVYYGTSKFGNYYYDKNSITLVRPKVFRVWEKVIFFKSVIDNLSIDNHIQLVEWDCVNNTEKKIKYVKYDDEGNILGNYDYPNPQIDQVSPDTISWLLLRKVCQE